MRHRTWIPAGFLTLALVTAACGSQSSSPAGSSASQATTGTMAGGSPGTTTATLKLEKTSLGTVLATSKGLTVYWFGKDTRSTSACSGACAAKWPPVLGKPQAAAGTTLPGNLGTITRATGAVEATYNGHPLYTFVGDSAPGQVNGNMIDAFGGIWYAVTVSGAGGGSPSPSPTSSPSSGGYGGGY